MDRDVERVLAFMQENLPAFKLLAVAHAVAQISHLIWARYVDIHGADLSRSDLRFTQKRLRLRLLVPQSHYQAPTDVSVRDRWLPITKIVAHT